MSTFLTRPPALFTTRPVQAGSRKSVRKLLLAGAISYVLTGKRNWSAFYPLKSINNPIIRNSLEVSFWLCSVSSGWRRRDKTNPLTANGKPLRDLGPAISTFLTYTFCSTTGPRKSVLESQLASNGDWSDKLINSSTIVYCEFSCFVYCTTH